MDATIADVQAFKRSAEKRLAELCRQLHGEAAQLGIVMDNVSASVRSCETIMGEPLMQQWGTFIGIKL